LKYLRLTLCRAGIVTVAVAPDACDRRPQRLFAREHVVTRELVDLDTETSGELEQVRVSRAALDLADVGPSASRL
jgi:hypothetical protein